MLKRMKKCIFSNKIKNQPAAGFDPKNFGFGRKIWFWSKKKVWLWSKKKLVLVEKNGFSRKTIFGFGHWCLGHKPQLAVNSRCRFVSIICISQTCPTRTSGVAYNQLGVYKS